MTPSIFLSNNIIVRLDIDFVGRRGFFCRLLRAVASLDKLEILVTLCNGTYYIENVKDTYEETARQIEMGFGGKKFAQCITSRKFLVVT